jgi:hypothetical protein
MPPLLSLIEDHRDPSLGGQCYPRDIKAKQEQNAALADVERASHNLNRTRGRVLKQGASG